MYFFYHTACHQWMWLPFTHFECCFFISQTVFGDALRSHGAQPDHRFVCLLRVNIFADMPVYSIVSIFTRFTPNIMFYYYILITLHYALDNATLFDHNQFCLLFTVTGYNIHLINTVVGFVCVFYTMLVSAEAAPIDLTFFQWVASWFLGRH